MIAWKKIQKSARTAAQGIKLTRKPQKAFCYVFVQVIKGFLLEKVVAEMLICLIKKEKLTTNMEIPG